MNAKRCTDSRKISVRQEFVIALGKDYPNAAQPNAAQTITCERRLAGRRSPCKVLIDGGSVDVGLGMMRFVRPIRVTQ
jgi:hypothetical protein